MAVSAERRSEVEELLARIAAWAAAQPGLAAAAVVGSWARGCAGQASDVDLVLLCDDPSAYVEDDAWIACFAPAAVPLRRGEWGAIAERRLVLPSGLELEVGVGRPSWASCDPLDAGTRRVVRDGMRILHDPQGLLAALAAACAR